MPKKKLHETDKECLYRQAQGGRPVPAIAESFQITPHYVRRVIAQKLMEDRSKAERRAHCWMCEAPPVQGDVFCGLECERTWMKKIEREYMEAWLTGKWEQKICPKNKF